MKSSPNAEHFVRISVVLFFLAIAASCKQDQEPTPTQTTAQFTESTLAFLENAGEKTITVTFDKAALSDGQITLKVNTLVPQTFETIPAANKSQLVLPVAKGQTLVEFKLIPSDNPSLDGCKVVKFSIFSVSEGMQPGSLRDLTVSMNDDEAPVEATFARDELNLRENDPAGANIDIALAHASPAEGILVVRLQSTAKYGVDYTTEPAAVGGKIFLHVDQGSTLAAIKVYPVNDGSFRADRQINFQIIDATGGLVVGESNMSWCTITEDDGYLLSDIRAVRSLFTGEQIIIPGDLYIEGTVTTIDNVLPGRVVVEDASGALQIQLNTQHSLSRGDVVLFNLGHGLLRRSLGVLEVSQVSEFEKLTDGVIRSEKVSLEGLYARGAELQSRTVFLSDLLFIDAGGILPMLGDRLATDGVRNIIIRTNPTASFRDEPVPSGVVNITGIFTSVDGTYVLYPQDFSDIEKHKFSLVRD